MGDWLEILTVYVGENVALLLFPVGIFLLAYGLYHYKIKLPAGASFEKETQEAQRQRKEYVTWRKPLADKGWVLGQIYSFALEKFLGALDKFLGCSHEHWSPFQRYWGPQSLDRCFAIALIYPIVTLFLVWAMTGFVGPIEMAFGLSNDISGGVRIGAVLFFVYFAITFLWMIKPYTIHQTFKWLVIRLFLFAFAFSMAGAFGGSGAVAITVAGAVVISVITSGAVASAVVIAFTVVFAVADAFAFAFALSLVFATMLLFAVTQLVEFVVAKGSKPYLFALITLAVFYLVFILFMVWQFPLYFSLESSNWLLIVFFGVLPIINALFDWISIGMTRYLLRRGQTHPRSIMPVIYAVFDLVFASLMMFALLIACLGYLGLLNHFAVLGSGQPALDLGPIMSELRAEKPDPSVWWIYVTIFTTFLPSFINLIIGCLSFIRGIPCLWTWVLDRHLPEDPANLTRLNRVWASGTLTFQLFIAFVAAAILGWFVLDGVLSFLSLIGANMLDVAQALIDLIG